MAFKNGVVIVMSCSKGGINKVLPLAGFCPDSQNIHSDGAKIRSFSITSKFFAIILCFRPFSAWKSKNFLYFCNQVLADRRDTTLLRQKILSPGVGAGMILVGKNIQH